MSARFVSFLIALQLATTPALAAEWRIDPQKSTLGFSGTQLGAPFSGRFERFEAEISFDPAKPEAGHARVAVDLASAHTGDVQRDEALPQSDWFDAKSQTQARFEATKFVDKGAGAYDAVGALTIRGVTRNVTLPFRLTTDGARAHATGHLDLIRTDFGVGQGPWTTGDWVALEVGVDLDISAVQTN